VAGKREIGRNLPALFLSELAEPGYSARGRVKALFAAVALAAVSACGSTGPANAAAEAEPESVFESGSNVAGKFLAGRHAQNVGDYGSAVELTRDVLEAMPDDSGLLARAHLLLISVGRVDEAVALAERLVALNDADPLANLTLALHSLAVGRYDDALGSLDKLELSGANRILVPLLRAWTLAGKSETQAALDLLDSFDASGNFTVIAGVHAAMIAELGGNDEAAAAAFARAAAASADGMPLQLARSFARFLTRTGKTDEARAIIAEFEKDRPSNLLSEPLKKALDAGKLPEPVAATASAGAAQALRAVADLLHREGVQNSALVFVRLALYLADNDAAMQALLGRILIAQEQYGDAIALLRSIDPTSPYAWYARLDVANSLRATDDVAGAIEILRAMVDERTDRSDAARALGHYLRFEERYAEAVEAYDKAIERSAD
jgi:tetratricopeptide (TPR) repeat protein